MYEKKSQFQVLCVIFFQAGAYHCNKTISGLWSLRDKIAGLRLRQYSFSEAGGGKSRCDTYAAIIKRKVNEFVNCGGNASTPQEFATAIASVAGVANVRSLSFISIQSYEKINFYANLFHFFVRLSAWLVEQREKRKIRRWQYLM